MSISDILPDWQLAQKRFEDKMGVGAQTVAAACTVSSFIASKTWSGSEKKKKDGSIFCSFRESALL